MPIEIRDARDEDVPAIAGLMVTLGYPTQPEEMRSRLAAIAGHPDYRTLVAVEDSRVVGMLGLLFARYYERSAVYARIVALSVAPGAKRRGVGSALVDAADSLARTRGAFALALSSGNHRGDAHAFYERLGFEARGRAYYRSFG
jgi:GNAT superfamily N-acetyltransferase